MTGELLINNVPLTITEVLTFVPFCGAQTMWNR